jgi:hypothetical protein
MTTKDIDSLNSLRANLLALDDVDGTTYYQLSILDNRNRRFRDLKCDVCAKDCIEPYYQSVQALAVWDDDATGESPFLYSPSIHYNKNIGHKECLLSIRVDNVKKTTT